jgi:RNA polymerase sigma-70 factor (ECF subfamily)
VGTPTREAEWVLRAQCGDRDALELLLRSVQPSLRGYLAGLAGSADADDILQDVLLLVARKLSWLDDPHVFRAWAFRIASRSAFRHLKRRRRWVDKEVEDDVLDELEAPPVVPSTETLDALLTSPALSAASRAVLVLHFREEMALADVAAILDLPLGTVKSRLAFGLRALRKQFDDKRSV